MSNLRVSLRRRQDAFALDADFAAPGTGVTALFGPSGSGKTTLLRCIAGLARAEGTLAVNGERWQDSAAGVFVPVHKRRLGYVFQGAGLFEHLSVRDNLEYGWRRTPPVERRFDLARAIEWAGIGPLLERRTENLSGGERSRVALARALVTGPRLLLMDEPLTGLDAQARAQIMPWLERLHRELGVPVLYVSHALDEVARLADHVVCLERGRVVGSGPVMEVFTRLDLPLAHADEASAVIEAVASGRDEAFGLAELSFPGGRLLVADPGLAPGAQVRVRILARDVSLALARAEHSSILNIFKARVTEIQDDRPAQVLVRLDAGGAPLLARITRRSAVQLGLAPGTGLFAQVKSVALLP